MQYVLEPPTLKVTVTGGRLPTEKNEESLNKELRKKLETFIQEKGKDLGIAADVKLDVQITDFNKYFAFI